MAGIIFNTPPIKIINPTSEIMPVNNAGLFVDSNIKNVVDDIVITQNTISLDPAGIKLDFTNELYQLGDPFGVNIVLDNFNGVLNINGIGPSPVPVVSDKLIPITLDGFQYYIQLYVSI
jgi:hypothetical protein